MQQSLNEAVAFLFENSAIIGTNLIQYYGRIVEDLNLRYWLGGVRCC